MESSPASLQLAGHRLLAELASTTVLVLRYDRSTGAFARSPEIVEMGCAAKNELKPSGTFNAVTRKANSREMMNILATANDGAGIVGYRSLFGSDSLG